MKRAKVLQLMLLTALGAAFAAGTAGADTIMQGRVSYADESGLVKGKDDSDWSYSSVNSLIMPGDSIWADDKSALEIEFSSGVFLRLADGSKLDVMEVPPSALFRGTTGSFYVQRTRRSAGDVTLDTPVGAIGVAPDSQIRVDILEEGATTVTVRWGTATIHSEGGEPVTLHAGERSFVDPGYLPSTPVAFDRSESDAFDTWNRDRARNLAEGSAPTPIQSSYSGGEAPVGVSDLNGHGEWVYIDNAPYWRPTAVEYVPYRYGRWSYVPVQGYVWIDDYSWAYTTTHYGHWSYQSRHGWCWSYYGAYRPAYAYTVHYGDRFVWAPMDVYGYPVHYGTYASFSIGNVSFSYGFSSFAYDYHVFGGYHNSFLVEYHHIYDNHHRPHYNDCDYWRIDSDASPYRSAGRPHFPSDRERTFAPERVVRGATLAADGSTRAADRAAALQTRQAAAAQTRQASTRSIPAVTALRTPRNAQATPSVPGTRRAETRRVNLTDPSATRSARGPQTTRGGAESPRTRTYSNNEARGAAPLTRGSAGERPSTPSDRVRSSSPSRGQQLDQSGTPERGRSSSRGNTDGSSTRTQRNTTPPAPETIDSTPTQRPRPESNRVTRPSESPSSGRVQSPPAERPRAQTTRPEVSRPEQPIQQPAPGSNRNVTVERPRPTTTRREITEIQRPEVVRPSAPERQAEPPRQQVSRPSAPERQQFSRPEAPQQQVRRPEPQRPAFESSPRQEISRPAPQYNPQPRQEFQPTAPAPQPRQEFRQPAPAPQARQESRPSAPEPSARSNNGGGRSRDRN